MCVCVTVVQGKGRPNDVPCHSRDVWAFGQLMLTLLEDTALEGEYKVQYHIHVPEAHCTCVCECVSV